ncbi:DUF6515 family protein [Spirosoma sp. SC4-14]|uniref:DUF6515 family protein n=1 Tax=Spirosoma sp. SC4-14 TaxID=3128900 RepID=UPI0030CB6C65
MKKKQEVFIGFVILLALNVGISSASFAQAVVRVAPRNTTVVVHRGVSYRYDGRVYYRPHRRGYVVVTPPVGLQVRMLPAGYTSVVVGGRPYFYFGGVYYIQRQPSVYEVVEIPKDAFLTTLPTGTETVMISGKRYYKINNTYYEKLISENGEERYVVAGERIP